MSSLLPFVGGLAGGVFVAIVAAVTFWIFFPEKTALILSQVSSVAAFSSRVVRRRVIRGRLEGHINEARRYLNVESPDVAPNPLQLQWATSSTAESYLHDGKVIVKLSYHDNPQRNLVFSALLYCRKGVLPRSRQYLRPLLQRAVDFLMVDIMLTRARLTDGVHYFRDEVVAGELIADDALRVAYETLCGLHQVGYFTRMYLPELVDYARGAGMQPPRSRHRDETERFTHFLHGLAEGPAVGITRPLDFFDNHIRVSVIIVGRENLLEERGHDPYLRRMRWCINEGAQVIYLTGAASGSYEVPEIAKRAKREGIVQSIELRRFRSPSPAGHVARIGFARLIVDPLRREAASPAAQQENP